MLRAIVIDCLVSDPILISENIIVNKVGSNNKVVRAKIGKKMTKYKSKNLVKVF